MEAQAGQMGARTRSWSFVQRGVFVVSLVLLAWSVAGLLANPDFTTGAGATSVRVLGVDMNGWHALSGFLLFGPGLIACRSRDLSILFAKAAILALVVTGAWALLSDRPAGLFPFDHAHADAILHFGSATAYAIVLGLDSRRST
jgi:Domain of unknown function (DUF4383)